jgi:hypothetical protein
MADGPGLGWNLAGFGWGGTVKKLAVVAGFFVEVGPLFGWVCESLMQGSDLAVRRACAPRPRFCWIEEVC